MHAPTGQIRNSASPVSSRSIGAEERLKLSPVLHNVRVNADSKGNVSNDYRSKKYENL